MCSVSYIKSKEGIILTSNRDEHISKTEANEPVKEIHHNTTLVYPQDNGTGGTWIGYNEKGVAAVLLNGAFENHVKKPFYRHSRGKLIPEILKENNPEQELEKRNLKDIEPFTLIVAALNKLIEYRWDEKELHKKTLDGDKNYFWCSATLYSKSILNHNQQLFLNQLSKHSPATGIYSFHERLLYELQLPEESAANNIRTISITQLFISNNDITIKHIPRTGYRQ